MGTKKSIMEKKTFMQTMSSNMRTMKSMKSKLLVSTLFCALLLIIPAVCFAADGAKVDSGDTTFVIFSAALVFIMTPGLAFFYGGMVRKKNVLNTVMNVFFVIAIVSIQWVLFGYSLSFGPDKGGLIGGLNWAGISGQILVPNTDYAATIPQGAFIMFQLMFAIITPALITGSFAERMRFPAFLLFTLGWATLVYDPLAHWIWGMGGWLRNLGFLDFAGGTVVHISSGVAGLVTALVLGKRDGYGVKPIIPHNIPFVVLGASVLWFGWIGFNAGSALAANSLAVSAFVATHSSGAAALLAWVITEWIHRGKPTVLGAVSGGIVGLATITQASGYVNPAAAIFIGAVGGVVCYFAIAVIKQKFGYDDSLDAFGCHGIGGIWGALATGLFATKSVNPAGADGLFFGNPAQFGIQALGIGVAIVFSAAVTFVLLKVVGLFTKLRVEVKEEIEGLDIGQHGEDAYPDFYANDAMTINM